jgi:hypothetical protein
MSTPCCACDKEAACTLRIVPRRDVEPLTIEMRRATEWPGSAMPLGVPYCGAMPCKDAIRSVATVVLAETVIEETQATETTA